MGSRNRLIFGRMLQRSCQAVMLVLVLKLLSLTSMEGEGIILSYAHVVSCEIRSPWSGFPCTLDVYVTQLKELLDKLLLSTSPVHLLGHCLGGAVAIGFAVKFPHLCKSICLIDSAGIRLKSPVRSALSFSSTLFI